MRKLKMKFVLFAFVLMYSHQAFEHVSHVHHCDIAVSATLGHDHDDCLFDNCHHEHDHHDHGTHLHFPEVSPENTKQCRKTVDIAVIASIINTSLNNWGSNSKHTHADGFENKECSSIPQYLRAQSFLI